MSGYKRNDVMGEKMFNVLRDKMEGRTQAPTKLTSMVKKISNPLAKYSSTGQLSCSLCNISVRTELLWPAHVNGKFHKESVAKDKVLKQKQQAMKQREKQQPQKAVKRKIVENKVNAKKAHLEKNNSVPSDFFDKNGAAPAASSSGLGIGYADSSSDEEVPMEASTSVEAGSDEPAPTACVELPEGFFDDPHEDAKAHNIEYVDPAEEEWKAFMKSIEQEQKVSADITEVDDEIVTVDRHVLEIDEQINRWEKVLTMEKKKEEVSAQEKHGEEEEMDDSDDDELPDFLDWRSKKT